MCVVTAVLAVVFCILAWEVGRVLAWVTRWVIWAPLAATSRFVLWLLCKAWEKYRVWKQLRAAPVTAPYYVQGRLQFDSTGAYVSVDTVKGEMRARVTDSEASGVALFAKTQAPLKESPIVTSSVVRSPAPSSQIFFRDSAGRILGSGVRVLVGKGGVRGVLTARHVLKTLSSANEPTIGSGSRVFPLKREWKVIAHADSLDMVLLGVPESVLSGLGVTQAKCGRCPARGSPIKVFGVYNGDDVFTTGVIGKTLRMRFTHTASTHVGFSGSPVFHNGLVIGVHTTGYGSFNAGVAVDWLFKSNLESDSLETGFRERELLECDEETRFFRGGKSQYLTLAAAGYDIQDEPLDSTMKFMAEKRAKGEFCWDEDVDEEDDEKWYRDFVAQGDFGKTESAPALKARGLVRVPVQLTEESTTGSAQTPEQPQVEGKGLAQVSLKLSDTLRPSPARGGRSTTECPSGLKKPSHNSGSGGGQTKTSKQSRGVSKPTRVDIGKVSSQVPKPSEKLSKSSPVSTLEPASQGGRVPADVRAAFQASGVFLRKGRRQITAGEFASVEAALREPLLGRARSFVKPASSAQSSRQ
jgi:hypothetical protein